VLLSGGGLAKWVKWAERFERRLTKSPNDPGMQAGMREPWLFKSWNEFEAWWSLEA